MDVPRAVWGYIEERDLRIMRRVHRWRAPRWIRYWMLVATRMGDGWLWYGLGLLLLAFGGAQGDRAVFTAGAAALAAILLFRMVKTISRRRRPCELEPHCWAILTPPDQYSFPSGHTMTACAMAVAVAHFYPEYLPWLVLAAASIGASRIILGMHFLTDVLVGALIGAALGFASVCVLG
jgi:undecaprenyl-diphosphatase